MNHLKKIRWLTILILMLSGRVYSLETTLNEPSFLNSDKAALAIAVIRANVIRNDGGAKYQWVEILNLRTYKSPQGIVIPSKLRIAHLSFGQGLPLGETTLYLTYYNSEKPQVGWKLVEQLNKKTYKYEKGYSHNAQTTVREVKIKVKGGEISGTLCKSMGVKANKKRAILFVSGSGAADRDSNIIGAIGKNNCLKYLSDKLINSGTTTLRIDKRGIGASKASKFKELDIRFSTYVDDITHCIEYLNSLGYSEIILLGHSEGALIATMAAKQKSVKSLILLSGVGRPIATVLESQLRKNLPKKLSAESEDIIKQLVLGKKVENVPVALYSLFRPSVQSYLISSFKVSPTTEIAKLNMPILIIHGTTDLQVSVKDAELLDKAALNSRLVIVKGMNHVLKAVGGNLGQQQSSYFDPKLPVHPELVTEVLNFIKE